MSTRTVLDDISARAAASGLSVGWVETMFDIAAAADLSWPRRLLAARADLPATRATFAAYDL
jgi:hypothetical protein